MIDRRELAKMARERRLSLVMIEKDYVLGWILFGISTSLSYLVLKGGTALSKVYFPEVWRLSEDLDFTLPKEVSDFDEIARIVTEMIFPEVERQSKGLKFSLKSKHQNPGYLQLKIQYLAVLETKNWLRIDVRKEELTEPPIRKSLPKTFSDYPGFELNIKTLEATLADKLLAMMERKKARDYYDIWKLLRVPELDLPKALSIFKKEAANQNVNISDKAFTFLDVEEQLRPYWHRELERMVYPVPDIREVLADLKRLAEITA